MGTTFVAFWAGVDGTVCDYCAIVRYSILQSFYKADSVDSGIAVRTQSHLQLCFHSTPVWTSKQSIGCY